MFTRRSSFPATEKKGTIAESAMKIIDQNIALAKTNRNLSARTPAALFSTSIARRLRSACVRRRSAEAGKSPRERFLRQNSVDSVSGKNDGTNVVRALRRLFSSASLAELRVRLV